MLYFTIAQKWGNRTERKIIPEHSVKLISEDVDDYQRQCVRIHIVGGGTYTVYCSLETFLDSCVVKL